MTTSTAPAPGEGGFTPGPWEVNGNEVGPEDSLMVIARVTNLDGLTEGNARLIAAAPDLLGVSMRAFYREVGPSLALRVQRNGWEWPADAPSTVSVLAEELRAAIAKALSPDLSGGEG